LSETQANQSQTPETQTPKKREGDYPVSETFQLLEGYDIIRNDNFIVALVAVESNHRRDIRLYRWQRRKDQWKVDLCRMSVASWKWDVIASKVKEWTEKYGIGKNKAGQQSSDE
jgi:hypothetical protein